MITVTFTNDQYKMFQRMWSQARDKEIGVARAFGHMTEAEAKDLYQLPADELLDDMADAFFAQASGVPMF